MLRKSWQLRTEEPRFALIARDLMRYSFIRQITPRDEPSRHVQGYYERIRNLPACANNAHFWLQFSLADIEQKAFLLAERHLDQSFAIAKTWKNYNMSQIDNVRALFLLSREIEEQHGDREMRSFVDANSIISRQMRDRNESYYPYRVASRYGEFWRKIAINWDDDRKGAFIAACQAIYRFSRSTDPDLAAEEDVIRCRQTIKDVLLEAKALPSD